MKKKTIIENKQIIAYYSENFEQKQFGYLMA